MSSTACGKCGEMVDAAKAFCPGCGSPLVAEQARESSSEFESSDKTMQMNESMYNRLVDEIGKAPAPLGQPPKPVNSLPKPEGAVIDPMAVSMVGKKFKEVSVTQIKPITAVRPPAPPPGTAPAAESSEPPDARTSAAAPPRKGKLKWVILAAIVLLVLTAVAAAVGAALTYFLLSGRIR